MQQIRICSGSHQAANQRILKHIAGTSRIFLSQFWPGYHPLPFSLTLRNTIQGSGRSGVRDPPSDSHSLLRGIRLFQISSHDSLLSPGTSSGIRPLEADFLNLFYVTTNPGPPQPETMRNKRRQRISPQRRFLFYCPVVEFSFV